MVANNKEWIGLVTENYRLQCQIAAQEPEAPEGLAFFRSQMNPKNTQQNTEDNKPVVGDLVHYQENKGELVINEILPRQNSLARKEAGSKTIRKQVVAANLDGVLLCQSVLEPKPSWGFLDRITAVAEQEGLEIILSWSKLDLIKGKAQKKKILDNLEAIRNSYLFVYSNFFFANLQLNNPGNTSRAKTNTTQQHLSQALPSEWLEEIQLSDTEQLLNILQGKRWLLTGPSGVGKSSLLNNLDPDLRLKTGEISSKGQRGRHTTTHSKMYELSNGSQLIDTAGMREFGISAIEPHQLDGLFPEMHPYAGKCRLPDCTHDHEPDCAIKEAVARGDISHTRYKGYLGILNSLNEIPNWKKGKKSTPK